MTTPLTAHEIRQVVTTGVRSSLLVAKAAIDQAESVGAGRDGLNILLHRDDSAARSRARSIDERIEKGETGLLAGVPVVVKDNIATLEMPT